MIVDDEPLALSLLSDYVAKVSGLSLVECTSDPMKALELAKTDRIDLIFLDMQMPELSGLQFIKVLQKRCLVIVTTAYSEFAVDGYEYHVVDYLLKPITFERFMIATEKALERSKERQLPEGTGTPIVNEPVRPAYIFVKTEYRVVKIDLDSIYYLEGARDYVVIHTLTGQILTLQSLRSLEELLPSDRFVRIHRSYIIALGMISYLEKGRIAINQQLIPIGDTFKERLIALMKI